jgi:hypothetical protein
MMAWLFWGAAYAICAIFAFRRTLWFYFCDFNTNGRMEFGDWVAGITLGICFGLIFGFLVPLYVGYKLCERIVPRTPLRRVPLTVIMSIPREERLQLREERVRLREERIAELERRTGIR